MWINFLGEKTEENRKKEKQTSETTEIIDKKELFVLQVLSCFPRWDTQLRLK